jgi:hypothetical protein
LFGLIGAVLGGLLGYFAFCWILNEGLYALALPGTLLGAGCGLMARHTSVLRGMLCGVAAVALGLYAEWDQFPFEKDQSLGFFLAHVGKLRMYTYLMLLIGALLGFYFGKGTLRDGRSPERQPPQPPPDERSKAV